ncbi:NeuD/PglB/VioB family sugar acetyltransferase [Capnocytophaga gingivalis]|jgi:sugar O-acyltransferase, sialic acid O-acetyltransferase neuD family|uniref:NeuD/PglB/VioB family sugar acetyltransferase n=1 Tax=Capnocytophaga gingivalis TaxID=1017 RepID=A0ABU5Y6Q2_9FLAO|nr:NeuD/PglB/VioB family sugar acetyltransferase [Capnocytophaga gingivalis]MEB3039575.1 NeuD/PglB/VioB family sugar acetyltransferase [Capnocytophaga gingivalis]
MRIEKPNIILVGGGGHCISVIDVIEQQGKYNIKGIIDIKENIGKDVLGYKIIGSDNDLQDLFLSCPNAIVSVGQIKSSALRIHLFQKLKTIGYHLPIVISPLAYVSKYALIGEGSIIMHQALVNAGAKIGKNCIINTKANIEHNAHVEDFCHISTGTIVNGDCIIGKETFIGSNATISNGVTISPNSIISAGEFVKR